MVYTVENTAAIGRPCEVRDSDGQPIPYVVWCDTETGDVESYARDTNGWVITREGLVSRVKSTHPAPLQIIFAEPN